MYQAVVYVDITPTSLCPYITPIHFTTSVPPPHHLCISSIPPQYLLHTTTPPPPLLQPQSSLWPHITPPPQYSNPR
ncbi:hypothetical protein Pcinc_042974 [Petrolisthes cinctipes]|uniref:Uncharacterized protein n=1 Tax=Petrolisthes cinctipes TaxID=88211 RepID=A0AAE1EIB3_PETCI|nr:hypothetical protein Pcinc_042974 [Petrolisthes cinctipes]